MWVAESSAARHIEVDPSAKILHALDDRIKWKDRPYKGTEIQVHNTSPAIPKSKKL
jgi:hypothetical protein